MSEREAVFVLKRGSCSWGKCTYCGFGRQSQEASPELLERDIEEFFGNLPPATDTIKVYGSGSFFDDSQFPPEQRKRFAEYCKLKKIKRLIVETRPEFVSQEKLGELEGLDYTVAIGLEVADNEALKKINKGFTLEDFERAIRTIKKAGGKTKAYLLVNLPLPEWESLLEKSVKYATSIVDEVVLINLLPHYKAPLYEKYLSLEWLPLGREEFLKKTRKYTRNKKVFLEPHNFDFKPIIPPEMQASHELKGATIEVLNHPHFVVWQHWLQEFYEKPQKKRFALFLQCSFVKPYSHSRTHKEIVRHLKALPNYGEIHQLVVSTPGVVPIEFDHYYPFNAYDWPEWEETPEVMKEYERVTEERVRKYLKKHRYEKVFSYLKPSSHSYRAVERACKKLHIPLINCFPPELEEELKQSTRFSNLVIHHRALRELVSCLRKNAR